jgi:diguanylate cyclase (GGDEF)-like protein
MSEDKSPSSTLDTHVVEVDPLATKRAGILTIATGLDTGRVLAIPPGEVSTLGRSGDCTFTFDDASLSREHARVMRVGTEYFLRDESSRNGTFVNNVRLTKAVALKNGDRIQLGSSTVLRFALVDEEEQRALKRVFEAATIDGLTGVYNRKHLEERITSELAYAARHKTSLAVVILDVDHFKKVNDTYGHLGGDAVLVAFAQLLKAEVRPEDVLARYGGEEFVVLLRGSTAAQGLELAERLRQKVEKLVVPFDGREVRITSSGGVASLSEPGMASEREALLAAADSRLYRAKQSGRNRVIGA